MRLSLPKYNPARLAVVLLGDRLAAAVLAGERVETFTIAAENPVAVLQEELATRQLAPRTVALGLARTAAFVKPIEVPTVGGDLREMLRLNLDGHVPFPADDAAFDFVPLAPDADAPPREEPLQRVLVVAAEQRVVDAALRFAQEAQLRPVSLTVAAHDLRALARPARGQKIVWVHRTGASADVLCLSGPALQASRTVAAPDEAALADEIRRTLAVVRWRTCDAIWISGDVMPLGEGMAALGLPVSEPDWLPRAQARLAGLPPEDRGAQMLALAVASGRGGRPLDLLPLPLRPRRLTRAQGLTLGVACVTGALLVTALLVPTIREQRHLSRVNAEIARVDPEVRAVDRVLRDLERKRKLLATINGIETSAMRPLPVLRELTELLPNDTWLTTLSLDSKGVELTGQAAAASALIPLLENSPVLERVEFSSPVTRGRDKEQFRIRAAWEPGAAARVAAAAASAPPLNVEAWTS
ncbi:MAG TPA: PilN domain-containing protein [Methylomirabilota bacterium]|nr:PilN domain-containing protein [Methylomirabilota bacterium]